MRTLLYLILIPLFLFTHIWFINEVPGLHFDEAWQALYAHKIATVHDFWPTQAMNSYTSPVLHYLLAFIFKLFGTKLVVLRGFFVAIQLLTLLTVLFLLKKLSEHKAALWFTLFWAILPICVHNHRFYVELTSFHPFLLGLCGLGLFYWKKRPAFSTALLFLAIVVGVYSHILFIAVFFALIVFCAKYFKSELLSKRSRTFIAFLCFALLPLTLRMSFDLKKAGPAVLSLGLVLLGLIAAFNKPRDFYVKLVRLLEQSNKRILILTSPFLFSYLLLMWSGSWPYAQATGNLKPFAIPYLFNLVVFLTMVFYQITIFWRRRRRLTPKTIHLPFTANMGFALFLLIFLFSSILIFKQSPRYYAMATLAAIVWCSQRLSRIRSDKTQIVLACVTLSLNFLAFSKYYIQQFQEHGATTVEFRFLFFHDNSRDFRPFQKTFFYLREQGCMNDFDWVEDDRFKLPIDFLRISYGNTISGKENLACPWEAKNLFLSHLTKGFDPPFPGVRILLHEKNWGDLAVWIRK